MNTVVGFSSEKNPEAVVNDLKKQFGEFESRLIIFFASSAYDPDTLNKAMFDGFSDTARVFGCTTAGEIISGKMLKNSVVAMGLNSDLLDDVHIEVVNGISGDCDLTPAFSSFERHYGRPVDELDFSKFVGIILADGLQGAEERIMDEIGDRTNITFIGGSAGDDLKFEKTFVFADGRTYSDAAILALLKPATGFDIIKTQSFRPLDKHLRVTRADTANREVIEFNHKPAAVAYAEAVDIPVEKAATRFMRNPVGLMVDGEPFVRSPQQILTENRMKFYCNVLEGMDLTVLESEDIVIDTREAVAKKQAELGGISGIINFHCILRTLELEAKNQTLAYGRIFSDIPTIGFSTYGEEYLGHINQTSTMLVFK